MVGHFHNRIVSGWPVILLYPETTRRIRKPFATTADLSNKNIRSRGSGFRAWRFGRSPITAVMFHTLNIGYVVAAYATNNCSNSVHHDRFDLAILIPYLDWFDTSVGGLF
jgi:hypothetical protein